MLLFVCVLLLRERFLFVCGCVCLFRLVCFGLSPCVFCVAFVVLFKLWSCFAYLCVFVVLCCVCVLRFRFVRLRVLFGFVRFDLLVYRHSADSAGAGRYILGTHHLRLRENLFMHKHNAFIQIFDTALLSSFSLTNLLIFG